MRQNISRTLGRGLLAGTAATVAMSAFMAAAYAVGALGEPPPKKLVRRSLQRLGLGVPRRVPLDLVTAAAHLGFGASMGAVFSLVPQSTAIAPRMASGALFGLAVWATSYAGWIPKLGLMARPSRDRPGRPTAMILAHVVYGAALGGALAVRYRPSEAARS